jgi:hypothetical protein
MPRLPVDGNKVIEHRITLGTFERQQLERLIDGLQIRNIGTGIGAATDPLEALFGTLTGTVGGGFVVAWALKRYFGIDVPIPTDGEDLFEVWHAIVEAVGITPEQRQEIDQRINAIKTEAAEDSRFAAVSIVSIARRIELAVADILFGKKDSVTNAPELYEQPIDYPDVPIDPGLKPTQDEYRQAVAARWLDGTYPFSYARDLLVANGGLSSVGASEYLNQYEAQMTGSN